MDETYLKVGGRWQYLYRAIDSGGHLVDVYLSETRNQAAAEAFFRSEAASSEIASFCLRMPRRCNNDIVARPRTRPTRGCSRPGRPGSSLKR
ncbi:DDE-type integrase/transposase/recombinase [Azospirillum sp. A26]|uniref:DDE-type integrase/transposase/recombinase n=1 Tax=Azospirillum sp. A26 TaxID=3160607 RepID=UPI00366F1C29